MKAWIQTYTGKAFWPLEPRAEDICIEDIAHALAHQCRFSGHCREFYSVAEHSIRVAMQVSLAGRPHHMMHALLHDASEAYLVDLPRPLKPLLPRYGKIEKRVQRCIEEKFGVKTTAASRAAVKRADVHLLAWEARDLMDPSRLVEWDWEGMGFPEGPQGVREECLKPMKMEKARDLFLKCFLGWSK
jgi:uncharacterized protein